jgi:hypothetical protein
MNKFKLSVIMKIIRAFIYLLMLKTIRSVEVSYYLDRVTSLRDKKMNIVFSEFNFPKKNEKF